MLGGAGLSLPPVKLLPASDGASAAASSSRGRGAVTAFVALGCEEVEAAILGPAHAEQQSGGTAERRDSG